MSQKKVQLGIDKVDFYIIILFYIMFALNAVNYDPYDMDIVKHLFNDVKR